MTKKQQTYAKRFEEVGYDLDELNRMLMGIDKGTDRPVWHTSGFEHPNVPVIPNDSGKLDFYSWGLIPPWVKGTRNVIEISNKTLNAKCETIFEKPSFEEAARFKRCLVLIDGFFEHHHKNGKVQPYYISLKNGSPMALAGLWQERIDRLEGNVRRTLSIVTTRANDMMSDIHNNPKLKSPRMPVILTRDSEALWMTNEEVDEKEVEHVFEPFDQSEMDAYRVMPIRGKLYTGNIPKRIERVGIDSDNEQLSLFDV
ncbi:MAG: SOS response-associated peptidase [Cyclobacteriaceae bacterium]